MYSNRICTYNESLTPSWFPRCFRSKKTNSSRVGNPQNFPIGEGGAICSNQFIISGSASLSLGEKDDDSTIQKGLFRVSQVDKKWQNTSKRPKLHRQKILCEDLFGWER